MHLTGEKCTLSNIKAVDMTDNTTESSEPTEISAFEVQSKYNTYFNSSNQKNHVTVHDPSVVISYTWFAQSFCMVDRYAELELFSE